MSARLYPLLTRHLNSETYRGDLEAYTRNGGYQTLLDALKKPPEVLRETVLASGLRGRGGAGFPTGMKWGFLDFKSGKDIYLICNADESEPGTFKDRQLIYKDPHQLIEGVVLSAYACSAKQAFVYIRGEFVNGCRILEQALQEARDNAYLGRHIAGSSYSCEIVTHRGAGAYICGEETGLIESLEGKRGYPRVKPPYFPATWGLYGCPTVVNNVETLCQVKHVLSMGADSYAQIGVASDPGTHLFGVSGHVRKPGCYEIESGQVTLGELLYDLCGGPLPGRAFKALIPGGSSTKILKFGEHFSIKCPRTGQKVKWGIEDIPLDIPSLAACGSSLGTGGVIVMDDTTSILEALANLNAFYAHESCGQCTPCREGSRWLDRLTRRMTDGKGKKEDIPLLKSIADQVEGRTICAHGEAVAWPVQSAVEKFGEEFLDTPPTPHATNSYPLI